MALLQPAVGALMLVFEPVVQPIMFASRQTTFVRSLMSLLEPLMRAIVSFLKPLMLVLVAIPPALPLIVMAILPAVIGSKRWTGNSGG